MSSLPRELGEIRWAGKPLTPMQRRVLRRLAYGDTGPEAAEALGVSPETVKRHLAIARRRLRARTTCHAVAIALSFDLI